MIETLFKMEVRGCRGLINTITFNDNFTIWWQDIKWFVYAGTILVIAALIFAIVRMVK